MFSLDKLVEYNQLVDCFTEIKDDFSACNREAHKRGSFVLQFVDESSSFGTLLKVNALLMKLFAKTFSLELFIKYLIKDLPKKC